ncbi:MULTISPECIES: hypothetical protein [unclassified Symbiopectobacterium]|nr:MULTISPECIES: hypothetical protein [unclassified Symbiopectobacterium]
MNNGDNYYRVQLKHMKKMLCAQSGYFLPEEKNIPTPAETAGV